MFRRALLGIASALLLPFSLQAQSESTSSPSPLEVTIKPTGQQKQFVSLFTHQTISVPELYFDIRNVSRKCVVGISLRAEDKDSEGKVMATGGATFFRQHEGKLSCLEPGQAFSESEHYVFFEKRFIQASIEIPRKYHQIVPVTPHSAQGNQADSMRGRSASEQSTNQRLPWPDAHTVHSHALPWFA